MAGRCARRWSNVAPCGAIALLLLLGVVGCGESEVDGTWRHPVDSEPTSGPAYELSLGQYGPDVAGLVRLFQAAADGGDVYARPVYCTALTDGEVTNGVLRFRFRDPDGVGFSASLDLGTDDALSGAVAQDDGLLNHVKFELIDSGVDKDCDGRTGTLALHGVVNGQELPATLRIAVVYTGLRPGGRFWLPEPGVATDPSAPSFVIEVKSVPDPSVFAVAPTDGSLRFAYGMFIAFDDRDGDGRWDANVGGGEPEALLGVAPDHALVYLEGRATAVYPTRPNLLRELDQSYGLVTIQRDPDSGELTTLTPVDPSTTSIRVEVPSDRSDFPFLQDD